MEEQHYLNAKARAQNYNPPVDLRLLDYVSPYDDNLMCPICRCPFVEPVVLAECDHCFCRDCIRQCWNSSRSYNPLGPRGDCPSCRTPAKLGPRNATNKILTNIVEDLMVKCPKSDEGCTAEVKRGEIADHVGIYCGYALVECTGEDCESPVRRKDAVQGCLHYGVSCLSCRTELEKWKLDTHWRNECPDRQVQCELCKSSVFYRELEEHSKQTCPAISIPCPGQALGCTTRSKRGQLETHAKNCMLARLAPVMEKQQQRLDEQEAAQKQMSRKLEVLENGFSALQGMLYQSPRVENPDRLSADSSHLPFQRSISSATTDSAEPSTFDFPVPPSSNPTSAVQSPTTMPPQLLNHQNTSSGSNTTEVSHALPHRRPTFHDPSSPTANEPYPDFLPPPSTTGGPYSSPLHHLLSLHESLRDETSRISAALAELDGRHSMQILNENLRTREEISYLGGQVTGVQRQVHWLTSVQLQRQQGGGGGGGRSTPGGTGVGSSSGGDASAGAGVEAAVSAVSTAATALRGAARVVNVGQGGAQQGVPMRRRTSEEGRTKL